MYADTIALCIYGKEYISNNLNIDSLFQKNTCFSKINKIIFSHDEINCFGNKEEIIDFSNINKFLLDLKERNGTIELNYDRKIGFVISCKFLESRENWIPKVEHNFFFPAKPYDIYYKRINDIECIQIDYCNSEKELEVLLKKIYIFLKKNKFKEQAKKIKEKSIDILKHNKEISYYYPDIIPNSKNIKFKKLLQSCFEAEFFLGFNAHCDDLYYKNLSEESNSLATELSDIIIETILYCVNNIT